MTTIQWIHPVSNALDAEADTTSPAPSRPVPATDAAGAILPAPTAFPCDIGAEIAILGVRAGRDEQQIDQTSEQIANELQDKAEQGEVAEMHREASDIMGSAVVTACMQIGQGMTQIAGAGAPQSQQIGYQGGASLWGAGATLSAAVGQAQQQLDQAQVTAYKAVADSSAQTSSAAAQGQTNAQSVINNAIQFYQEYAQTQAQAELTAAGQKA
jgi:hypothetical protein